MDVVGLGALNLDVIYRASFDEFDRIQKGIEKRVSRQEFNGMVKLLKRRGELITRSGGGSAANTIYALARMGFSCGFVGKTGEDEEGDFLMGELAKAGVDTGGIRRKGRSGICLVLVDREGERSILVSPNTNDTLQPEEIDLSYINRAKFFHNTSFLGENSFKTQRAAVLKAENFVSFDPGQPYARKGWKAMLPFLKKTKVLFITQKEIEILTGGEFREGLQKILECGTEIIVCKRGGRGSLIVSGKGEWPVEVQRSKSVDTTGAGDVYAAGFLAGFLKGLPINECGKLGTAAAAVSITGFGRQNYPDKNFFQFRARYGSRTKNRERNHGV